MTSPEVSIVMPAYNAEKYIRESINSILESDYNNFELIIINDGSVDSTKDIILSFNDSRIKYIEQINCGVGGALKNGCKHAIGEFILRIDADDISIPHRIRKQRDFLVSHPDYVLVGSAVFYINSHGEILGRSYPYTNSKVLYEISRFASPFTHPSVMFRKSAYVKSGGYFPLEPLEDFFLWYRMRKFGKFENLTEPLIFYRINEQSVSASLREEDSEILRALLFEYIDREVISDEFIHLFRCMFNNFKGNTNQKFEETIKRQNQLLTFESKIERAISFSDKKGNKFIQVFLQSLKSLYGLKYIIINAR